MNQYVLQAYSFNKITLTFSFIFNDIFWTALKWAVISSYNFRGMLKEASMMLFKILSHLFHEETEENHYS
jgi:hypothetical protein